MKLLLKIGEKFGKLVVISRVPSHTTPSGQKRTFVRVQCECGTIKEMAYASIRQGKTTDCGCVFHNPMWKDEKLVKDWMHNYYLKNQQKLKEKSLNYGRIHKEEKNKYMKERREKDPERFRKESRDQHLLHPERKSESDRKYRETHKEYLKEKHKNNLQNNIQYRIKHYLRARLRLAIRKNQKKGSAIKDLGCSIPELKIHLEKQFRSGMTWDNYGQWHIDHIFPLSKFDLTERKQFLKAVNYTNLQPLWAKENLTKSAKII